MHVLVTARGGQRRRDRLDVICLKGGELFAHECDRVSEPDAKVECLIKWDQRVAG